MSRLGDLVAAAARVVMVAPRRQSSETDDQQFYRFWHLEYGETAYYDQLVFRRHRDVAPPGALAMDTAESIPSRASREHVEEPGIPEQRSRPLTDPEPSAQQPRTGGPLEQLHQEAIPAGIDSEHPRAD